MFRAVRYCAAVLLGFVTSAAALTATPTVIPTPSPTPFECDGVLYPEPVLEFTFNIEPPRPVVGDTVTVTVTVRNTNGGFVGRPLMSIGSSVPILSRNTTGGPLYPFNWTPVAFEFTAVQPGTTQLTAGLTYEARTGCCGYCYTPGGRSSPPFSLSVGGGGALPDLIPSYVNVGPVNPPECVTNLAEYVDRNPLPLEVCVGNVGGADAGPFAVEKDGRSAPVSGLAAGTYVCVSGFSQSADVPTTLVRVDTEGQVVERDEDNNERLMDLQFVLPPQPPVCGTPTQTPIPEQSPPAGCPGDCDASGQVRVDELVRGVHMALDDGTAEACRAFDGDSNGRVTVNELVEAVDAALRGCEPATQSSPTLAPTHENPIPTPTNPPGSCCCAGYHSFVECQAAARDGACIGWSDPCPATATPAASQTSTPTATPSDAVSLAHQVFTQIASDVCHTGGTPGGEVSVEMIADGAVLRCGSFTGHRGTVNIRAFPTVQAAVEAFASVEPGAPTIDVGGGSLRIRSWTPQCCQSGLSQRWGWLTACWLVTGDAFDDTHFLLAPQPRAVVDAILQSPQAADLLSSCLAGER